MVPGIQCGIGLNLGLPIGIVGGLIGGLLAIEWQIGGWLGFLFACVVGMAISAVTGALYGMLLNRLKGSEMSVTTYVGFSIVSLMCILPFINLLAISFSDKTAVAANAVSFWPVGFNTAAYEFILGNDQFLRALAQKLPFLGQDDFPPSPDEELFSQLRFQIHQLLGQGRLGHMKRLRRRRDVFLSRHSQKIAQHPQFHIPSPFLMSSVYGMISIPVNYVYR